LSDLLDDLETQDYKCPHKDLDQPNNINLPELEFNWWL
jgi:hypothetical protein